MTDRGWFIVDRSIFDEPLLSDPVCFRAWMWLVAEAAWKPRRQEAINGRAKVTIDLECGQVTHSLRYMAKAWNVTVKRVRTILRQFEAGSLIKSQLWQKSKTGTQTGTLQTVITICNYEASQTIRAAEGTQTGTERARKGHRTYSLNTLNKERGSAPTKAQASPGPTIAEPERKPETFTDDEWRQRLETFQADSKWPAQYWGPAPGKPGCLVPAHLLVKPIINRPAQRAE
jgi:hypothetical protein